MLSGDTMNNKGFTLMEILAAIVILGIVIGIGISGGGSAIENTKKKSEEIFVGKFKDAIIEYLELYGSTIDVMSGGSRVEGYKKCKISNCDYNNEATYDVVTVVELKNLKVNDLFDKKILTKSSVVNPRNKKECFNGKNPNIRVFRDNDYVYYFYVNLSGSNTNCEISDENAIISTLPDELADRVGL